jgi:hypothetical protein
MKSVKMMMNENQSSQSQVHVTVLRVKCQKASLNKRLGASTCGGRAWFSPYTSHMTRKWMVNTTLVMGNQADPTLCYKFHILQATLQYTVFYNIILGLGMKRNSEE